MTAQNSEISDLKIDQKLLCDIVSSIILDYGFTIRTSKLNTEIYVYRHGKFIMTAMLATENIILMDEVNSRYAYDQSGEVKRCRNIITRIPYANSNMVEIIGEALRRYKVTDKGMEVDTTGLNWSIKSDKELAKDDSDDSGKLWRIAGDDNGW